jgi:hypothetical protein
MSKFEQFLEETRPSNNINGGLYDGLSCGLIGLLEWSNNYRYYVVDLSRRLPEQSGVPLSLQLMCQVNVPAGKYVDLFCYIFLHHKKPSAPSSNAKRPHKPHEALSLITDYNVAYAVINQGCESLALKPSGWYPALVISSIYACGLLAASIMTLLTTSNASLQAV